MISEVNSALVFTSFAHHHQQLRPRLAEFASVSATLGQTLRCVRLFNTTSIGAQALPAPSCLLLNSGVCWYVASQIGGVQGLAQFLCQLSKGVSGVVGDIAGSQASSICCFVRALFMNWIASYSYGDMPVFDGCGERHVQPRMLAPVV